MHGRLQRPPREIHVVSFCKLHRHAGGYHQLGGRWRLPPSCRERLHSERYNFYHPEGGDYDTEEEAHLVVEAEKVRLGWKPKAKAANQCEMKGVRWAKGRKQLPKWRAEVVGALANQLNGGKYKSLGSFDDVEEAKRTLTAWIAARENGVRSA
jgi:hypothetical protein